MNRVDKGFYTMGYELGLERGQILEKIKAKKSLHLERLAWLSGCFAMLAVAVFVEVWPW